MFPKEFALQFPIITNIMIVIDLGMIIFAFVALGIVIKRERDYKKEIVKEKEHKRMEEHIEEVLRRG
jgi:predicted histidine transporter YuiF (NhaC family)